MIEWWYCTECLRPWIWSSPGDDVAALEALSLRTTPQMAWGGTWDVDEYQACLWGCTFQHNGRDIRAPAARVPEDATASVEAAFRLGGTMAGRDVLVAYARRSPR